MKCPNCGAEMAPDEFGDVDGGALMACVPCKVAVSVTVRVTGERKATFFSSLSAAYAKLVANNPERPDSSVGG